MPSDSKRNEVRFYVMFGRKRVQKRQDLGTWRGRRRPLTMTMLRYPNNLSDKFFTKASDKALIKHLYGLRTKVAERTSGTKSIVRWKLWREAQL